MSRSPSPRKHSLRGNEGGRRSMSLSPIRTESGAKLRTANWTKVFRAPAYRNENHRFQRGGYNNNRGYNQRSRFNYRGGRGNYRGNNWNYNRQPQRRFYNRSRTRSRSRSRSYSRSRSRTRDRSPSPGKKRYSYSRSPSPRDNSRWDTNPRTINTEPKSFDNNTSDATANVTSAPKLVNQPKPAGVSGWDSPDVFAGIAAKKVEKQTTPQAPVEVVEPEHGSAAMQMEKNALASIARHEKSLKKIKQLKMADDDSEKKKKKKKMKKKGKKMKKMKQSSDSSASSESSDSSGSASSASPSPLKRKKKKKRKLTDSQKPKSSDDEKEAETNEPPPQPFAFNFPQMAFPQGGAMPQMMVMPGYEKGKQPLFMIAIPGPDGKMTMVPAIPQAQAFQAAPQPVPQPVPEPTNQNTGNVIQIQTEKKELTEKQKKRKEIIRTRLWPRPVSSKWDDDDDADNADKPEGTWPLKGNSKNPVDLPKFDFEEATESFSQSKAPSGTGHIPGFSPDRKQEVGQKIPTLGGNKTFENQNENKIETIGSKVATEMEEKFEKIPVVQNVTQQNLITSYPTQHMMQHGYGAFGAAQKYPSKTQSDVAYKKESKWSAAAQEFINQDRQSSSEGEISSSSSDDQMKKKKQDHEGRKKKRRGHKQSDDDAKIDEKLKKKKKKRKDSVADVESPIREKKRKKKKKAKDRDDDSDAEISKKMEKKKRSGSTAEDLIRHIPEDLPLQHLRGLVPRKPIQNPTLFHSIRDLDEQFVALLHQGEPEMKKKSLKKIKITPQGSRNVSHMTKMTLNERIRLLGEEEKSEQKVQVNLASLSNVDMEFPKRKSPPKVIRRSMSSASSHSRSRSRSRSKSKSLPKAYNDSRDYERREASQEMDRRRSLSRSPDRRYHDNRSRGYYGNNQRYNQRYRGHNQYRGNYQNYNNRGNYYHNNRGYNRGYNNNYRGRGYYNNNNYNRDQRPQWKPRRHDDDDRGTRSQERSRSRSSSRGDSPKRASYAKEMRDHRVVQSSAPASESPRPADARDQIESAKKFAKLRRKSPDQWAHDMFQESDKDDK